LSLWILLALNMETLVINIRSKKDAKFVRELLDRMNITVSKKKLKQVAQKKFKSDDDFLSFAGSMKGKLISKEHLRESSWKKRN
jgi:hypothetical protein